LKIDGGKNNCTVLMRIKDFDWKTMGDWFQELGPINNYIGK
jgi:hypothetical protein